MQLITTAACPRPSPLPGASLGSAKAGKDKNKKAFIFLPSDTWGHLGSAELGRGKVSCWILGGAVGNNMFGFRSGEYKYKN